MVALVVVAGACSGGDRPPVERPPATTTTAAPGTTTTATATAPAASAAPSGHPLLVAAGDIACKPGLPVSASQCQHEATARLVEALDPDVVAPLGDLQYEFGEAANFAAVYDPSWGRFKDRSRPAPGNHEYAGGRAPGYFGYFGATGAGVDGRGWYSYDLGDWHVVVLNTVCSVPAVGGCGEGSDQLAWLRRDLAAHPRACTLAYGHHPRHTSGLHGEDTSVQPLWDVLSAAGADLVLGGHDHHYERFEPIGGIRQFVVGTGGRNLYPVLRRSEGSEVVDTRTFGVLALTLRPGGYDWRFVPIPGSSPAFSDEGSAAC